MFLAAEKWSVFRSLGPKVVSFSVTRKFDENVEPNWAMMDGSAVATNQIKFHFSLRMSF